MEALAEASRPDGLVDQSLVQFAAIASRDIPKVPVSHASDRRLSVMAAGYQAEETNQVGFLHLISNFETLSSDPEPVPFGAFQVTSHSRHDHRHIIVPRGMTDAVRVDDLVGIHALMAEGRPPKAIAGKALEIVRDIARRPLSRGLIGEDYICTVVPADPRQSAVAWQDVGKVAFEAVSPNFVDGRSESGRGLLVTDAAILYYDENMKPIAAAIPKVGRNTPCPCGSGSKYKNCHGK